MTKRVAMIFLVFSLVIGMSVGGLVCLFACTEVDDPQGGPIYVITGSAAVGPWIVLFAVSCFGLAKPRKGD